MGEVGAFLSRHEGADRRSGLLRVGSMASGAVLGLPFVALRGARPGKTLWLNGQVHGDEINGVVAALQFANSLDPGSMTGNVVVTPTANPQALDQRRKRNAFDDLDLDQCYPGAGEGLMTERVAHVLFSEVRDTADVLINLHTMNPLFDARPYGVYKVHPAGGVTEAQVLAAMAPFFPRVACRMSISGTGELPGNIAGALDYQCLSVGILAFMLELGSGSCLQEENVAQARNGFHALAQQLGILSGEPRPRATEMRRVTKRGWITAREGGLFLPRARAGDDLDAGGCIGDIMGLDGSIASVPAFDRPGVLIGLRSDPVVHSGERLAFVGWQWDQVTC